MWRKASWSGWAVDTRTGALSLCRCVVADASCFGTVTSGQMCDRTPILGTSLKKLLLNSLVALSPYIFIHRIPIPPPSLPIAVYGRAIVRCAVCGMRCAEAPMCSVMRDPCVRGYGWKCRQGRLAYPFPDSHANLLASSTPFGGAVRLHEVLGRCYAGYSESVTSVNM